MITVRVQIPYDSSDSSTIVDTTTLGLVYLDSDKRVGPETKGFEATTYPEEEGEHISPKTVDDAFDYTVKFFVQASSVDSVNAKINTFNQSLYTVTNGVKTYKQVAFYNDYKRHLIVGYPYEIPEATEFWRDKTSKVNDIAIVEWKIRVTKPSLCNFNYDSSN